MRVIPIACVTVITVTCGVARAQPNRIDSIRTPPSSALTEYWTDQRLQDAKPMEVPVLDPRTLAPVAPAEPKSGTPRSGPPKAGPRPDSGVSGSVSARPLYWAGRLAFNSNEGPATCSAQFVAPGILATAAHCIQDDKTGRWFTHFLYQHQYVREKARNFQTECVAAYRGWVSTDNSRWTWDFAMIKLRGGTDIGHFGWQYGWWGKYNSVPKIGYPAAIERAQVIQVEFGTVIKGWDAKIVGLNHGNPRNAEGSSGGAWVGGWETSGSNPQSNYIISVTSHHMGDERGTSYGPYWDESFVQLMNYTQRGCR
jgi:hypothetical protein